jgi:hypothetical protein
MKLVGYYMTTMLMFLTLLLEMISYRASRFKKPDSGYELYIVDGKNERK